jgi:transcription initiation factor TFIID TATA-box-binding protein
MESFNSVSGFSSTEELNIPNQTPLNQPVYMSLDSDSNSNSQISYYNQVFGNSNPIQNILDNHNILLQKEKNNEANNSFVKEDKSTNLCTNENKMPQPQIVNIVSMVNLRVPLNLKLIALKCRNSEYNPSRINAVIMRIKEPKAAALIFNSGIIIVLGARDKEKSKQAAKIFAKQIKNLGYEVKFSDFNIVNIVATCDLGFPIKLTQLNIKINYMLSKNKSTNDEDEKSPCHYEPEVFPGLIYHMTKPELTLLIFQSGKMNFVGAKNKDDIYEALQKIYPLLCKFKNQLVMNTNEAEFSNINNA